MPIHKTNGFTLIEFLVVLGILALTVGSALLFLTSTLRGTNQANVTAEVKQNGQVVLDSLERQIRGAISATELIGSGAPAGSSSAISLALPEGKYFFVACFNSVGITSNGWIGTVSSTSSSTPGAGQYVPLTNRDRTSGVEIVCDSFRVTSASSGALNPPIVRVSFTVNQGVGAPSRSDFKANVKFDTTISLRKY